MGSIKLANTQLTEIHWPATCSPTMTSLAYKYRPARKTTILQTIAKCSKRLMQLSCINGPRPISIKATISYTWPIDSAIPKLIITTHYPSKHCFHSCMYFQRAENSWISIVPDLSTSKEEHYTSLQDIAIHCLWLVLVKHANHQSTCFCIEVTPVAINQGLS